MWTFARLTSFLAMIILLFVYLAFNDPMQKIAVSLMAIGAGILPYFYARATEEQKNNSEVN